MTDVLPDGFHCVCCGLDSLSVPSLGFLDWDVSCMDDRVIACRGCMDSGQAALDAIGVALISCRDVPPITDDNAFEVDREAAIAAIATWGTPVIDR